MQTVHSPDHVKHEPKTELCGGQLVPPFEKPSRVQHILDRIDEVGLGPLCEPVDAGLDPILRVHDPGYVHFLRAAWSEWVTAGFAGEAIPISWPARRMSQRCPSNIEGKIGYYALGAETSLTSGTWEAAYSSAQVAITATDLVIAGSRSAFALCRPPGHHVSSDLYGGYCFLNNAAIAAERLIDHGLERIAIIDVDFHHGNGTQDIFFDRHDVLFASLHGEPNDAFPYFLGYRDETGTGLGAGYNVNYPMARGTGFDQWRRCLVEALDRVTAFQAQAVVISLGLDTFESDPISFFRLTSPDFFTYGSDLATLDLPTIFVLEGGYSIAELGLNAVNVLQGFETQTRLKS